jgi:hypothetical protein
MDDWELGFNAASKRLLDATYGWMQFGTITVAPFGRNYFFGPNDIDQVADILVYENPPRRSCLAESCGGNPGLGQDYRYFTVAHIDHIQPWYILHEFSHYAFCLYDEYIDQMGNVGLGKCCNIKKPAKCIMEMCAATVTQYCDREHTKNNQQEAKNHLSCWSTIKGKYPDILKATAGRPFSEHTPITWNILP